MSGFTHGITPVRGKWSNFLPDKEFRYLRHVCYLRSPLHEGARSAGRSFLPPSPCRHGGRTISSSVHTDARRGVSEGSADSSSTRPSLLIVPTRRIVTVHAGMMAFATDVDWYRGIRGSSQHIAEFCNGLYSLTVIVTAAVYRRLGSELRFPKEANPSP
jgi:hypothetical protein